LHQLRRVRRMRPTRAAVTAANGLSHRCRTPEHRASRGAGCSEACHEIAMTCVMRWKHIAGVRCQPALPDPPAVVLHAGWGTGSVPRCGQLDPLNIAGVSMGLRSLLSSLGGACATCSERKA
jgi:hypothetical protein